MDCEGNDESLMYNGDSGLVPEANVFGNVIDFCLINSLAFEF